MHLMRLDVTTGRVTALTDRDESLWSWSSAQGGSNRRARARLVRRSAGDLGGTAPALRQISSSNAGATRFYGKAVSLRWKSDHFTIQGWLIYPLNFDPPKRIRW